MHIGISLGSSTEDPSCGLLHGGLIAEKLFIGQHALGVSECGLLHCRAGSRVGKSDDMSRGVIARRGRGRLLCAAGTRDDEFSVGSIERGMKLEIYEASRWRDEGGSGRRDLSNFRSPIWEIGGGPFGHAAASLSEECCSV